MALRLSRPKYIKCIIPVINNSLILGQKIGSNYQIGKNMFNYDKSVTDE